MSLHLFAGLRVRDFEAARPWYERLLGEPTFLPHPTATTTTPSFSPPTRWCSAGRRTRASRPHGRRARGNGSPTSSTRCRSTSHRRGSRTWNGRPKATTAAVIR